jgi:hypothetical protein
LCRIEHRPHAGFDFFDGIGSMGKPVNDHRGLSRLDLQNLYRPKHAANHWQPFLGRQYSIFGSREGEIA